jgi:outer membrane receptor protein involved in Fe transport
VIYCLSFILLACCLPASRAQSSNAAITGRVTDASKAMIPGAHVTAINTDTNARYEASTNDRGVFTLPDLPPGPYRLEIERKGFKTVVETGILLHVQDTVQLNYEMALGASTESVTVTADTANVNVTDATVSTVVDRLFVENLPLNGRSFQALVELSPGVVLTPTQEGGEQGQFSINGNRPDANYFTIDGVSANFGGVPTPENAQGVAGSLPAFSALGGTNNLVSVDALQEFRIETSNFAPEFGRGGAQIMLVTRSGTNQFHGTLFDYLRNDIFDATDWFADSLGIPKAKERQNDFGGVVGGPIIKDRTFFFFSYEGLRLRQPRFGISDVPSLWARQNGAASAQPFLNSYPKPNGPDTVIDPVTGNALASQFASTYSDPATLNATSLRIDHNITSKINIFGRYNYSPSHISARFAGGYAPLNNPTITEIDTQTATAGVVASLSTSLVNDFRFNFSQSIGSVEFTLDNFGGAVPAPDSDWFPATWGSASDSNGGLDIFGLRGTELQIGDSAKNNQQQQINLVENLSYIRGNHQLKFGFDYRRLATINGIRRYDVFAFYYSMQSLINGVTDQWNLQNNEIRPHLLFHDYAAYAQDTWKMTPRLTLTYGLRWEHNPPPSETTGNPPFVVNEITNFSTMQLLPRGAPLWHASWANFAPRIGVSYLLKPSATRPLVLRGGAGLFYAMGTEAAAWVADYGTWPYSQYYGPLNIPLPLTLPSSDFPVVLTPPYGNIAAFDPHLKVPYSGQWNVTLEQGLGSNQKISATYVGSAGRDLLRQEALDSAYLPINPIFTTLTVTENSAYSNYNALQVQYQRTLSHGLQALVSYTFAHSLDNASTDTQDGFGYDTSGLLPSEFYNLHSDYGDSTFDIRHVFNTTLSYDLPGRGLKNAALRFLAGGWAVDGIIRAHSAPPFTVVYTPDPAVTQTPFYLSYGAINLRPDVVPGESLWISDPYAPGGRRLNPSAFALPTLQNRQGDLGRDTLRAFGATQADLSLRRTFTFHERFKLLARADAFNITNHPNFGYPNDSLGVGTALAPGFGVAAATLANTLGTGNGFGGGFNPLYSVGGPRSMQISLKLQF